MRTINLWVLMQPLIQTNNLGVFVGSTQNSHKIDRTSKDRAVHLGLTAEHRFNVLTPKIGFIQSWVNTNNVLNLHKGENP